MSCPSAPSRNTGPMHVDATSTMHTWYTYPVSIGHGGRWRTARRRDVDQAGDAGAAGGRADVRLPAARRVRATDRLDLAAQRRAGLHDPVPARARRPRRAGGRRGGRPRCRRGRTRDLPRHRGGAGRGVGVVHHPGASHPAPARRAGHQARARGDGQRRRRRHPDPAPAQRHHGRAPGLHPAQALGPGRQARPARGPRLEPGPRRARLRRRGGDPVARPLRGPAAARRGRRERRTTRDGGARRRRHLGDDTPGSAR